MRPEKRYQIITNAISTYLDGNSGKLYKKVTMTALKEAYEWVQKDLARIHLEWDMEPYKPDLRSGYETYGYGNTESLQNNMFYIWGKWNCPFRIRWLIDGIQDKHF